MIFKIIIVIIISSIVGIISGTISNFYYKFSLYKINLTNKQKLNFIYKCLSKEYFKNYFFSTQKLNKMIVDKIKKISNQYSYSQENIELDKTSNIKSLKNCSITLNKKITYDNSDDFYQLKIEDNLKKALKEIEDINIGKKQNFNEVKTWEFKF